jgi:hypothetical protein
MHINLTPRLRLAAKYLHEHGWAQDEERNSKGQVCITGAIRYCVPQNGDEYLAREVLRNRNRAENWNDNLATTAEEVEEYLRTTAITDADLANTFGPEWQTIVTLVRRIATLTAAQLERLGAVVSPKQLAAFNIAQNAVLNAGRYAEWYAAGDAARDAEWDVVQRVADWSTARGSTARDAALAVIARDLIGKHGFTQNHYDTLTGPWRETIGQLHPDDPELES